MTDAHATWITQSCTWLSHTTPYTHSWIRGYIHALIHSFMLVFHLLYWQPSLSQLSHWVIYLASLRFASPRFVPGSCFFVGRWVFVFFGRLWFLPRFVAARARFGFVQRQAFLSRARFGFVRWSCVVPVVCGIWVNQPSSPTQKNIKKTTGTQKTNLAPRKKKLTDRKKTRTEPTKKKTGHSTKKNWAPQS